jgi:hypothetical protein
MGKKSGPKAPDPIDPGESMGEYLFGKDFQKYQGVTDPRLQEKLIGAEAMYRPRYTALELADIATMARGLEGGPNLERQALEAELEALRAEAITGTPSEAELQRRAEQMYKPVGDDFTFGTLAKAGMQAGQYVGGGWKEYERDRAARVAELESQVARMPETVERTPGLFDLLEEQSARAGALQREQLGLQRAADVAALGEYAPQVVEAYRAADPYSTELAEAMSAEAMRGPSEAEQLLGERGLELAASTGELTPLEARRAQQSAREASVARGRGLDQSALYGEMQSRMAEEMGKREREMALGTQLLGQQAGLQQQRFGQLGGALGAQRQLAGDIGMTILGRPSSAIGLGGQMLGQAQQGAAGQMGPQLFDPNVGINMAMQQQANEVAFAGAQAQSNAARSSGLMSAAGSIAGAAMFSDSRLKRNIKRIGTHITGIGIYCYNYIWGDTMHIGVMAQELQKVKPEAVIETESGYLAVDYNKL